MEMGKHTVQYEYFDNDFGLITIKEETDSYEKAKLKIDNIRKEGLYKNFLIEAV